MMSQADPYVELKQRQREMWSSFAPTAMFTTPVAAQLVAFARIASGERVLDVATGTGVVAITAARAGARVDALDLTPELLEQARENARIARLPEIVWTEGDAENLPYPDATFDVVTSQFGHIFAPRPDVAWRRCAAFSSRVGASRGRPGRRNILSGGFSRSSDGTLRHRRQARPRRRYGEIRRSWPNGSPPVSRHRTSRAASCNFRRSASNISGFSWRPRLDRCESWWRAWLAARTSSRRCEPSWTTDGSVPTSATSCIRTI